MSDGDGADVVPFDSYVLGELVALRGLVETLFEVAGIELRSRETPGVLSLGHAVEALVQPSLDELARRQAVQVSTPTVRHVVRDENGEIAQLIELPASYVSVNAKFGDQEATP